MGSDSPWKSDGRVIVILIFDEIWNAKDTLVAVVGDHGMRYMIVKVL